MRLRNSITKKIPNQEIWEKQQKFLLFCFDRKIWSNSKYEGYNPSNRVEVFLKIQNSSTAQQE